MFVAFSILPCFFFELMAGNQYNASFSDPVWPLHRYDIVKTGYAVLYSAKLSLAAYQEAFPALIPMNWVGIV